jgi:hypothetical protein
MLDLRVSGLVERRMVSRGTRDTTGVVVPAAMPPVPVHRHVLGWGTMQRDIPHRARYSIDRLPIWNLSIWAALENASAAHFLTSFHAYIFVLTRTSG